MNDSRLVYSTKTGRICSLCSKPISVCVCKKRKPIKAQKQPNRYPSDGVIRIQREIKGRKGKTVTTVFGLPLESEQLQKLTRKIKGRCGAGGSVKEGVIIIQ